MNKIVSNFYLIRLEGTPVYVGYTNRPIKTRLSEHKRTKDFGEGIVEVEDLGNLEYNFSWDISIINTYAREVSDRETELITEYGTQGSIWQQGVNGDLGGQTWNNVKNFVRTNRDNPIFRDMKDSDILEILEMQRKSSQKLRHMVVGTHIKGYTKLDSMITNTYIKDYVRLRSLADNTHIKSSQYLRSMLYVTSIRGSNKLRSAIDNTHVKGAISLKSKVTDTYIRGAQKLRSTINDTHISGSQKLIGMVKTTHINGSQKLRGVIGNTHIKGRTKLRGMVYNTKTKH